MVALRKQLAIGRIAPERRETALKGTIDQMARVIATERETRVLVLTGRLDGRNGLPRKLVDHGTGLRLMALGAYTPNIPTAIFEVNDDDALCAVIDALQEEGGYKARVLNADGNTDPHYTL